MFQNFIWATPMPSMIHAYFNMQRLIWDDMYYNYMCSIAPDGKGNNWHSCGTNWWESWLVPPAHDIMFTNTVIRGTEGRKGGIQWHVPWHHWLDKGVFLPLLSFSCSNTLTQPYFHAWDPCIQDSHQLVPQECQLFPLLYCTHNNCNTCHLKWGTVDMYHI